MACTRHLECDLGRGWVLARRYVQIGVRVVVRRHWQVLLQLFAYFARDNLGDFVVAEVAILIHHTSMLRRLVEIRQVIYQVVVVTNVCAQAENARI